MSETKREEASFNEHSLHILSIPKKKNDAVQCVHDEACTHSLVIYQVT